MELESAHDLLDIAGEFVNEFAVFHASAALHRIAKANNHYEVKGDERLRLLASKATRELVKWDKLKKPQTMSKIIWAMAKLELKLDKLVSQVSDEALQKLPEFEPQQLVNMMWAYATLRTQEPPLRQLGALQGRLNALAPLGRANLAWSVAKLMVRSWPIEELVTECRHAVPEMNGQNLANTSWAFATLRVADEDFFDAVAKAVKAQCHDFAQQNLSNTAWAFAKVQIKRPEMMSAISQSVQRLGKMPAQGVANTVWAFATLNIRDEPLMSSMRQILMQGMGKFQLQNVMNSTWAYAKLTCADSELMAQFTSELMARRSSLAAGDLTVAAWCFASADHCDPQVLKKLTYDILQQVRHMTHQDLSNLAWALARLSREAGQIFEAISQQVIQNLPQFEPQNLAITAWAFATVSHEDDTLFQAIGKEARKKVRRFDPQCCANVLYSFGRMAVKDEELLDLLVERLRHSVDRFKTLELCNAAWGISKMKKAERGMQAIASSVVAKVKEMNPQDLSRTAWAFANARIKHEKLMDEISWEVMAKIESFGNQDLSNTSWAFAKLAVSNAMMMTAIGKKLMTMVKELIPQDLANTAWAFATLGLPESNLMDQILLEVISKVNDFTTQNLANTAWAYAKLGLWNERLMQTLANAIHRKIWDFDSQGLANVAWSFAVLGFKCPKLSDAILAAAKVKIEADDFGAQELANIAWSWDVLGDEERLRPFLEMAIPRFTAIDGFSDAAASTDLANIAVKYQSRGSRKLDHEFRTRFFEPLLAALQKCARPGRNGHEVEHMESEVQRIGLTNFGYMYAREAFRELGFQSRLHNEAAPQWVAHARLLARKHTEEWRIPGTENIVAVVSYELHYRGQVLRQEPKVVTNGWAEGVHNEVKAMLRAVDARGWSCESYSQRVALLELLEAARSQFGDGCVPELSGWLRIYDSHHTSVTGLAIFCQFRRQAPQVDIELDYDGGWHTWAGKPRPLTTLSSEESLHYYS